MKFVSKIALASTVALALSASSAFAFGGGHFQYGGMAKYYAKNTSGATGNVKAYNKDRRKRCGCKSTGYLNVTNSSEQYNSSYRTTRFGYTKVGGESGARNQITTKWKNLSGLKLRSSTSAFGTSGVTNKRH